jgi:hypothetical protein
MQKIISIIIITIALSSCGTEDLREANLRILTLKKQRLLIKDALYKLRRQPRRLTYNQ